MKKTNPCTFVYEHSNSRHTALSVVTRSLNDKRDDLISSGYTVDMVTHTTGDAIYFILNAFIEEGDTKSNSDHTTFGDLRKIIGDELIIEYLEKGSFDDVIIENASMYNARLSK